MTRLKHDTPGAARRFGITMKIAVVTAIALLLFAEVTPILTGKVLDWFAPDIPTTRDDHIVLRSLLLDDERIDPQLDSELRHLVDVNRRLGMSNFLLDVDDRLIWRSEVLALCRETDLERRPVSMVVTVDGERMAEALITYETLTAGEEVVGYAGDVYLTPNIIEPHDGEFIMPLSGRDPLISGMIASDRHLELYFSPWALRLVALAVSIVLSVVIGVLVSLLVTRRVRALARDAAAGTGAVPGPFRVQGRDEIGRLSRVLNVMRTRIETLMASLTDRDEKRRQWLAQVSHDIRTPLTSALISIDRAQSNLDAGSVEEARTSLREAQHDVRRLGDFADDLFELSRLELEPLRIEEVLPNEIIRSAATSVQADARRQHITIETHEARDLAPIEGDGHRLMRACENLLSNSIRYAADVVTIEVRSTDDGVEFTVADDGPGFSGESRTVDLDRVQERADSTGLGLIVVRRVAEAHGGDVIATNGGSGARVTMVIPRAS